MQRFYPFFGKYSHVHNAPFALNLSFGMRFSYTYFPLGTYRLSFLSLFVFFFYFLYRGAYLGFSWVADIDSIFLIPLFSYFLFLNFKF